MIIIESRAISAQEWNKEGELNLDLVPRCFTNGTLLHLCNILCGVRAITLEKRVELRAYLQPLQVEGKPARDSIILVHIDSIGALHFAGHVDGLDLEH